ncbi:acyl carrier protein [Sphingomonas ginkgonis]|uniref:acyl carrier protein n=1 Tax=Sphingomonas ginkgonis TaxID=2315330 RepID=UPI00163B08BA|nr:acyl carrier protein [Sphingomonas ginkgonis]
MDANSLKDFLASELGISESEVDNDTLLFSTGVVDSFALVAMMTFIENETGYLIPPTDITLDNFDSIDRILAYLRNASAIA